MPPQFSVLIPVFNAGSYLRLAIESVLGQTYEDWELIVLDDGSTDGAVQALQVTDPRVRIHRQPNRGAPAACNALLEFASGPLLAFLDQDDLWAADKLQQHWESFQSLPSIDFNFTWSHYIGPDGARLPLPARAWSGPVNFELLLQDFVIGNTSSIAIRRSAVEQIGGFDESLACMYDLDLILRVARLRSFNGIAIERDLCSYRRHEHQMSRDWGVLRQDWMRLLAKFSSDTSPTCVRAANANMTRYFSFLAYECGNISSAASLLRQSCGLSPRYGLSDLRNWKLIAVLLASAVLPVSLVKTLTARFAGKAPSAPDQN
ncbi:MAG TPA: glycosyltransferase [Bryobacteraceae bacterium]|nr:glycosyltransferase [Bryobacteraceae bacterium]